MAGKILLTGITGYIGKHVALRFLKAGYAVCGCLRQLDQAEDVRAALRPHLPPGALLRLSFAEVDLLADEAWAAAMVEVSVVIHAAAPFGIEEPMDLQELIRPMLEGTVRVMRMAKAAGVGRFVMVSSVTTVLREDRNHLHTEADWGDPAAVTATGFAKAKMMAERAAWALAAEIGLDLTVVNPGLTLGPPLGKRYGASVGVVRRVLRGRDPMMPRLNFAMVDVRDVVEALLRVVERPATVGKRYILVSGTSGLIEMARVLKQAYPRRRFATTVAPRWMLRLWSLWDAEVAAILPRLEYRPLASNARAAAELGLAFIPQAQTITDTAEWLIRAGED